MTCQVIIQGPNDSTAQVRALLDSGCEASFITERLSTAIGPISSSWPNDHMHRRDNTKRTTKGSWGHKGHGCAPNRQSHSVRVLVLTKITSSTPACLVSEQQNWNHFTGLSFADPNYGTPGFVDLLLGSDMFARVVLHGWKFGPSATPSAF